MVSNIVVVWLALIHLSNLSTPLIVLYVNRYYDDYVIFSLRSIIRQHAR